MSVHVNSENVFQAMTPIQTTTKNRLSNNTSKMKKESLLQSTMMPMKIKNMNEKLGLKSRMSALKDKTNQTPLVSKISTMKINPGKSAMKKGTVMQPFAVHLDSIQNSAESLTKPIKKQEKAGVSKGIHSEKVKSTKPILDSKPLAKNAHLKIQVLNDTDYPEIEYMPPSEIIGDYFMILFARNAKYVS